MHWGVPRMTQVWDPLRSLRRPWFSVNKLRRLYGQRGLGDIVRDFAVDVKHAVVGDPTGQDQACAVQ